ncbi:MAG: response regulator [bacterium]|nr:response regulator [bacterium]
MKKILLVEDDPFIMDIYSIQFKKEGYQLDVANDCQMALEKMKTSYPDLAILDIDFGPGKMSGWDLLKIIRDDPQLKNLSVVILSNQNKELSRDKIAEFGVRKFFLKVETSIDDITDYVKKILK